MLNDIYDDMFLLLINVGLLQPLSCARAGLLAHARSLLARICRLSRSHFGCRSVQITYLTKSGDSSGQRWRLTATTLLTAQQRGPSQFMGSLCSVVGLRTSTCPIFSSTKQVPVQPKISCLLASKKKSCLFTYHICSHRQNADANVM